MSAFRLTGAAEADLGDLTDYFRTRNPAAGRRLLDAIERQCEQLADFPEIGESRPELGPGIRCFPVQRYVVYYRAAAGGAEVLRVLHGSRDVNPRLFGG